MHIIEIQTGGLRYPCLFRDLPCDLILQQTIKSAKLTTRLFPVVGPSGALPSSPGNTTKGSDNTDSPCSSLAAQAGSDGKRA